MAKSKKQQVADNSGTGQERKGVYNVKESGLEYHHIKDDPITPKDGEAFLQRFR